MKSIGLKEETKAKFDNLKRSLESEHDEDLSQDEVIDMLLKAYSRQNGVTC